MIQHHHDANKEGVPPLGRKNRLGKFLKKIKIDVFLTLLLLSVVIAWMFPAIGAYQGTISLSSLSSFGISIIFFFYGLRLSYDKFRANLGNTRLHVTIHLITFVLFPVLILLIRPMFQGDDNILLWLGIFYLAVLPSTVSSSVVMVSIAGGNIPAAILNASISSLMGVFITPLLMSIVLSNTTGVDAAGIWSIIGKLVLQIILPVALGMLLNSRFGAFAEKHNRKLRMFDQTIILLIVYTSFCASFENNAFDGFSSITIIGCVVGMMLLFFIVYFIVGLICSRMKMNREDTITAQFCSSKKSLVHGSAMAKVIFAGYHSVGIILLPIMIYHVLQIIVVSAIAKRSS